MICGRERVWCVHWSTRHEVYILLCNGGGSSRMSISIHSFGGSDDDDDGGG